ncbi:MAG: RHS repeat-associated core domain-containing protein, partial [Anaerolineae bacterium]
MYFYNARYYDPALGRFAQADTLIPNPGNLQSLNRYAYAANNPLRFSDPSGHAECEDADCTRVLHPRTGKLVRRQPAHINWASVPAVVQFIYQELLTNAKGSTVSQLANLNSQCMGCGAPAIAGAPSVARMSDQVNRLKAMVIFAWKVRQGGEWDPKPKLVAKFGDVPTTYENRLQEGGPAYYYDVWGNIEYGYLGTASAF